MDQNKASVFFLIDSLSGGGAQKVFIRLATELTQRGYNVSLLTFNKYGPNLKNIPSGIPVIELSRVNALFSVASLVVLLKKSKCNILISGLNYSNVISFFSSFFISDMKIIRTQHNVFKGSSIMEESTLKKYKRKLIVKPLMSLIFKRSDCVVAVSPGVKEDLINYLKINPNVVKVIYNPVLSDELLIKSKEQIDHKWFDEGKTVLLGVGRLSIAKDFKTLIKAFSIVNRSKQETRLIILGEGESRKQLEKLIDQLALNDKVCLPGFVNNPIKYMKNADLFVLSSKWEGFGLVLVEAMSCSTPVVSTDCQTGPADILEHGKWGRLVPTNNPHLMAEAILETLKAPIDPEERAHHFSVEKAADEYEKLF